MTFVCSKCEAVFSNGFQLSIHTHKASLEASRSSDLRGCCGPKSPQKDVKGRCYTAQTDVREAEVAVKANANDNLACPKCCKVFSSFFQLAIHKHRASCNPGECMHQVKQRKEPESGEHPVYEINRRREIELNEEHPLHPPSQEEKATEEKRGSNDLVTKEKEAQLVNAVEQARVMQQALQAARNHTRKIGVRVFIKALCRHFLTEDIALLRSTLQVWRQASCADFVLWAREVAHSARRLHQLSHSYTAMIETCTQEVKCIKTLLRVPESSRSHLEAELQIRMQQRLQIEAELVLAQTSGPHDGCDSQTVH